MYSSYLSPPAHLPYQTLKVVPVCSGAFFSTKPTSTCFRAGLRLTIRFCGTAPTSVIAIAVPLRGKKKRENVSLGWTNMLGMRTLRVATRAYASAAAPKAAAVASFPLPTHAKYDPELDPQLAGLDYPLLSSASRQLRSPKGYWDSQERANFDEPVSRSAKFPLNRD